MAEAILLVMLVIFLFLRNWRAVLVPLVFTPQSSPSLLLTVRNTDLPTHPGQIAFPGGKRDPADPTLEHTALREAEKNFTNTKDEDGVEKQAYALEMRLLRDQIADLSTQQQGITHVLKTTRQDF